MGRGCTTIMKLFYCRLNDLDVLLHFLVTWCIGEYGMRLKKIIKWAVFEKFQKLALVLLTSRDQLRNDLLSFVCQIILLYESCIYIFFPHIYLIFHWIILDAMHFFLFLKFLFGINEFYFWSFLFLNEDATMWQNHAT